MVQESYFLIPIIFGRDFVKNLYRALLYIGTSAARTQRARIDFQRVQLSLLWQSLQGSVADPDLNPDPDPKIPYVLGFPDPDPMVRDTDPASDPDPST
jgi:hypothetical protein